MSAGYTGRGRALESVAAGGQRLQMQLGELRDQPIPSPCRLAPLGIELVGQFRRGAMVTVVERRPRIAGELEVLAQAARAESPRNPVCIASWKVT